MNIRYDLKILPKNVFNFNLKKLLDVLLLKYVLRIKLRIKIVIKITRKKNLNHLVMKYVDRLFV